MCIPIGPGAVIIYYDKRDGYNIIITLKKRIWWCVRGWSIDAAVLWCTDVGRVDALSYIIAITELS